MKRKTTKVANPRSKQTNKKVDFQIRLLLLDHSVQIEKTSEISGDGSKLQSNLFL